MRDARTAPDTGEPAATIARITASAMRILVGWFDSNSSAGADRKSNMARIDWPRLLPFFAIHAACVAVIWVGWSWFAVMTALALYVIRMVAITGFYHRYFSHRAFKTSRAAQLVFAVLGASAAQRGPLWWASHHRYHHAHADQPDDPHSLLQHGFLWSHMGWFGSRAHYRARMESVPDLAKYPELRWLDRYDVVVPLGLAVLLYGAGELAAGLYPDSGTSGLQLLVWGFCISTVALYHATFTINSIAHRFGRRRYPTRDQSRNNWLLAVLTFGEGWHNNHHHFPGAARQGFYWWEIDITYYVLYGLSRLGVIWNLRPVPDRIRAAGQGA